MILAVTIIKIVQGIGNVDNAIMDMLRQIVARVESKETSQRRGVYIDDISDE